MAEAAAAPYAQVMEDMAKGREYATQLQALLRDSSPEAGRLLDRILHAMARTIDTAKAAAEEQEASEVHSDVTCAGTAGGSNGKRKASAGGDKRPACRKRGQQSSAVIKNAKDLEDGHAWRKYGQKEIQNCKYPKAYFRCTHKYDQKCLAQRQVQRRDDDPEFYTVTYIGVHTCRDPAVMAPLVVHAAGAGEEIHHAGSRLISFAAANGNGSAATTSTTTTGNTSSQHQAGHKDGAAMLAGLRPLKLEAAGGEQEEVLSSLTPAGNAAAATTPGPDQGDVTSGLQLQQFYGGDDLADMGCDVDDTFWTTLCSDSITDMLTTEL